MATYRDYTKDEIVERGEEIYRNRIQPLVEGGNRGKYLVLDIETGEYEVGDDMSSLAKSLHTERPEAPLYPLRIGSPYMGRIGGRPNRTAEA
jgi:hypothetical protein